MQKVDRDLRRLHSLRRRCAIAQFELLEREDVNGSIALPQSSKDYKGSDYCNHWAIKQSTVFWWHQMHSCGTMHLHDIAVVAASGSIVRDPEPARHPPEKLSKSVFRVFSKAAPPDHPVAIAPVRSLILNRLRRHSHFERIRESMHRWVNVPDVQH